MRQSPSLLALLTVSATLGFASQARGDSLLVPAQETGSQTVSVAELVDATEETPDSFATPTESDRLAFESFESPLPEEAPDASSQPAQAADLQVSPATAAMGAFVSVHQLSQQPDASEAEEEVPEEEAPEDSPAPDEEAPADPDAPDAPDAMEEDATPPETEEPETEAEPSDEEDAEQEAPEPEAGEAQAQVLVAEVAVADSEGTPLTPELENRVYDAIGTRPGQTTTRDQLQQDINSIFATGFFANVRALPTDTPLGVRVTFVVDPNPVLSRVEVEGGEVLPDTVIEEIFAPQYGDIINLLDFQDGILALNNWYQENGYVLAQVVAAPQIGEDGVVTLQVAEGVIEDIEVRFMTEEGLVEDEEGNPIRGKTREFIITREFSTQPGDVFQQRQIQSDLQRVFGLGIFDDVNLSLNPGRQDPRKVTVVVNVVERNTGSVAAGVGFNFTGDLFGTLSYRQDNFGGNNQKFSAETQLSTRDLLFDISFTDPWIGGDPNKTSYTVNAFARRSISLVFEGGPDEIDLENGDRVRVNRYGGGVTFRRPLNDIWEASVGTRYQRVRTTDEDGDVFSEDAAGNPLTASGDGTDDLWTVQFGIVQDLRNDAFTPTSGSVLRVGTEQSIPLGSGNIFMNRLRGSYSYYLPVSFLNFSEGPQALAFNIQGGTIVGDLPPYEAFSLGGTNSVRGYEEGEVGAGRSYLQASIEYRFPLFSFLGGALFLDAATDLGSGDAVPGSPGPDRGKPGSGFGYGAGVRIQTPLGPIRVDYGINDEGDGRLHFGIGERF
ncbi:MAG: BamA/TamA family outer membrane protein [Leptolyngbya sp. SIO1E4]|nr:BamA/TamA family outer membrane protein [Leptolyngbya sp. SIO1E4]